MNKLVLLLPMLLMCFSYSSHGQPNAQDLKVKWRLKTEGPIRADAVVDGDDVFVVSSDGKLYALRKNDGKRQWKLRTRGSLTGEPAVSHDMVVVVSRDSKVYAVNRANGRVRWKFRMHREQEVPKSGWKYFSAAPVISQRMVYVGSGDGNTYALDRRTGHLRWKFRTGGQIRATPLVDGHTVYQPSNDGAVYALDAYSGKLLWRFETDGYHYNPEDFGPDRKSIYTTPIIVDDTLIIGSRDGNVYAVDTATQNVKWRFSYGTTWAMSTAVDENNVYVGWSTNNLFSAVDLQTGEEQWQFRSDSHNYTTALITDGAVYFGSADGNLYQLDKVTGDELGRYEIGREIFSSPVYDASTETIFVGSDNGVFYAMQEKSEAYPAVYQPSGIEDITQFLVVNRNMTPYLTERGYEHLDSPGQLQQFLQSRISDQAPSVVVFAQPIIPQEIIGDAPSSGLMRQYLESGGKVVWFGDPPNYYALNEAGEFSRDAAEGSELLGVHYTSVTESGNYYSRATQHGENWGLPEWLKTTATPVSPRGVTPLAYDEFGRVSAWVKGFCSNPTSGFVSIRTWGWNVPINEADLLLTHQVASYGLE